MIKLTRRKSGKVTLLYSGKCSIDEALERGSHLKSARDEITKKYNQNVRCQVGSGGHGFYGADLRMSMNGLPIKGNYQLEQYYVVNLEAANEGENEALREATLEFVSLVPEKTDVLLCSHKGLEREIKQALSEKSE